jgi:hypothetical protein
MSSKAETLARKLLRENRGTRSRPGRSWRVIAREDYENKIPFGTLCRFAISNGAWLPKIDHQFVLGLKHERKPITQKQPPALFEMATSALRRALAERQPMPPTDPRIIREFKKLGWLKSVRTQ